MRRLHRNGLASVVLLAVGLATGAATAASVIPAVTPAVTRSANPATTLKQPHQPPRVVWTEDVFWSEIVRRAEDMNRPILIDFYAPWCGPCKALDAMVYNEQDVIDELSGVVTFKVDIDKPQYLDLKNRFAIDLLPTLVWCDPNGDEFDRFTGFKSPVNFLKTIRGIRNDRQALADAEHSLVNRPEDGRALLTAAGFFAQRGDTARARVLYRRLAAQGSRPSGNGLSRPERLLASRSLLDLADLEHGAGNGQRARALARRAARIFKADDPDFGVGLREVATRQVAVGDTLGAVTSYRLLMELDDMDVDALEGYARTALQARVELREASRAALRAAVLSDEDPVVVGTLAECYYRRGLYRKAIRWIQKSIAGEPGSTIYQKQLARFEKALKDDPWGLRGVPR